MLMNHVRSPVRLALHGLSRCKFATLLWLAALAFCGLACESAQGATYHVATNGVDSDERDGLTVESAWASLAFACQRVPAVEHVIQIGAGTFVADRTAFVKSRLTIRGSGSSGESTTTIVASKSWPLVADLRKQTPPDEFLIAVKRVDNVAITDLVLASDPEHRIAGGLFATGVKGGEFARLYVHDFRWTGMHVEHSSDVHLHNCRIENASLEKHGYRSGLIRTTWLKHSEIHHNQIIGGEYDGYGYKGGGHERVRLHHNVIRAPYFAIESAHENEFGVEIDHNELHGCVSIPKGGQGADPNSRGCEFSFWVHDNLMTDSYTIEGPRNHLRLSHNYIRIERTGGRVYTHHGGINHGPVWIHNNVVENLDRAFVWMNEGLAENIHVYNNTVLCADAGERTGSILGAYSGERLNGWIVENNVFVCPPEKPRPLMPATRGVPDKIAASHNLCVNVTGVPTGNFVEKSAGFVGQGEKPWPFFEPSPGGNLIDRGADVALPFQGRAPDLGARELGDDRPFQPDRSN